MTAKLPDCQSATGITIVGLRFSAVPSFAVVPCDAMTDRCTSSVDPTSAMGSFPPSSVQPDCQVARERTDRKFAGSERPISESGTLAPSDRPRRPRCTRARESLVVFGTRIIQKFSVMTASLHTQSVGKSEPRWRDSYHIEQQRLEAHHHRATPKGRGMHAPTRDEIVDDERHDKNICGEE